MKIGLMLRHLGQPGGIGIYTANIVKALLTVDTRNQYYLMYRDTAHMGSFGHSPNVTEVVIDAPTRFWWDQVAVPRFARQMNIDIVFNPKLSIPLNTRSKTVLISHGGAFFVVPQAYPWYNRAYFTLTNQLYFRHASAIISVTQLGGQEIMKYMHVPSQKVHPIHESYNERCRVLPRENLAEVKEKYHLPDHFLLWVGGISPLKNIGNLLRAYALIAPEIPHQLVLAGFLRWKFSGDLHLIDELGLKDRIVFTNYVSPEDIPALYNLADLFVFPSIYEGFGLPILEAMACGCPVITSTTGYAPEVAGNAGLLVNPYRPEEIATAIRNVLRDDLLRQKMIQDGLEWVKNFSWEKTARETVALFESLVNATQAPAPSAMQQHHSPIGAKDN